MKLLNCTECHDIVSLVREARSCHCGKARGRYVEGHNVEVSGKAARIIGISNQDYADTVAQGKVGLPAFIVPIPCATVKRVRKIA